MSEELLVPPCFLHRNEKFKKFSSSHPGFVLPSGAEYRIISFMNKISPYGYLAPGRGDRSREGERAMLDNVQMLLQSSLPMIRVGVADILDIAILSLVIHRLLWMLRKTSSGRVLRGILILMFSMWVSSAMHLTATSFLLNKLVEWGFLVLVILFQPEIRRFLERMGSSSLGQVFAASRTSPMDLESAIDQTVEAYTDMSRDKVGALMVFERQNLLDDVIKTGTALDCAVSSELLKNLFWNKAPLHAAPVRQREPQPGPGYAPPGGHRHERAL